MSTRTNILIGSDTSATLTTVMKCLQTIKNYSFITATRVSDIIQISKSLQPSLMILCFRDNQSVIDSLQSISSGVSIPLLCLCKEYQYKSLRTHEDLVIFTQSYEHAIHHHHLAANVSGILKLLTHAPATENTSPQSKNEYDLTRYTLELDQKKEVLEKIKERITQLYSNVDPATKSQLMSIVNTIKMTRNDRKHWEDFKRYFENVNPNFIKKLTMKFPCLTAKDLKYCCYLKMNMSNEDIRLILGINQESVRTHKYRLKKKMVLEKNQDLRHYLQSIAS